jgi:nuclear transcription factor Y alpha
MMEYAQYQQQAPPGQHQAHMQGAYPNSGQHPGPATITSPTNQPLHQQHSMNQSSPILPSQQQNAQAQGHPVHQQMGYQPQYGVPPQGMHYGMPGISTQAAAMAATAAASGQGYTPYMPSDTSLQQTSPRMGGVPVKKERQPRSPQQMNHQMGQQLPQVQQPRRMSQQVGPVQSPAVPNSQPIMNHTGVRPSVPPMPTAPQIHQPQSPELVAGPAEESPLYVNAKQFHRILKRRVARQRLEEALRLTSKGRKPYLHESRHNHAMRRPRGPGGRFLTADEVAEIERTKAEGGEEGGDANATPAKALPNSNAGSGTKRKAEAEINTPSKKAKTETLAVDESTTVNADEEEEEEEEEDDADDDG